VASNSPDLKEGDWVSTQLGWREHSLVDAKAALPVDPARYRTATTPDFAGPLVRLQIGLEDTSDLIADLERGLAAFRAARG